jgi:selenide,water dikinase
MDISVLQDILKGGLDKIKEAQALLVGGHSVEDEELKYGLSVTGTVHPDHILTNRGARAGDQILLTKPIGTGILNTAIKGNLVEEGLVREVTAIMSSLNRRAAEVMKGFDVSACTDVTGFGLLGHACEMIDGQEVGLKINPSKVPLVREALNFARMGIVPAGAHRNRDFRRPYTLGAETIEPAITDLLFDPQTSGGLLFAVSREQAEEAVTRLSDEGMDNASLIGEFVEAPRGKIILENRD